MLTDDQKEKIQNISFYRIFYQERHGIPISNGINVSIPSFPEIKNFAFSLLLRNGFSNIEQVAPTDANCIIRIFSKTHYPYQYGEFHNLFGFNCFTKYHNIWLSSSDGDKFQLDFSKCEICQWIRVDNYITYSCDFLDCYIKIS